LRGGARPTFETIKIPTGGGLAWTIPGEEEEDVAREVVGVILDQYRTRVYWPGDFTSGGTPPECSSMDARTGFKYGECAKCEFSQWGTGRDGRGQACKLIHRVYVLLAGRKSIFPYLIPFPPTSSPEKSGFYEGCLPTYITKVVGRLKKLSTVWTRFKLLPESAKIYEVVKDGKKTNVGGEKFSKVQCFMGGDLTDTEKKTATFLKEKLRSAMREKSFESAEYDTGGNGEETRGTEHREADRGERVEDDLPTDSRGPDPWDK